ncbi:helix-turn-helix transcriptional regulator [Solwaraspora sp. WMMD406]|uniref:helix-turn-helix domain-containing protein n=1 Tax=Solwaraspora sp. WMMD406 TaxID=3016095 RepID=UPI002416C302|nr:helix-turn-helix transcriptional regulator [Solwaraspora sp. WMMD406]MDG4767376.1 helix-turn-helix transcriptional regulator [Solwaraspora sp. WMMD406]
MPARHQGPTIGRRRLRAALRRAREAADLTQDHVARQMDWSLSKLIRIESGSVSVSTNDVKALLDLYGVRDHQQVAQMVELARAARRRAWWSGYKDRVPPAYAAYIGLEADAAVLQYFQPISFPGLLQTEEYARAVIPADGPHHVPAAEIESRVQIRLARQHAVLHGADPPQIEVILDEAALRRVTGGTRVLREQLRHVATMCARTGITVRVLPFTAGSNTVLGPFVILRFADHEDGDVVYVESALVEEIIDRPADVRSYQHVFDRLRAESLSPADSVALLRRIAEELG